ncbi:MAG: hypothetical protein KJ597_04940 [Nanoarchaeota archaeon]|nr:hypothetical protein [Nanoarchaeota archaeon]
MKMNKKAAIGLSMNVLVIFILSIVILAGGITLLYKFIGGAEEQQEILDQRTQQELERLLIDQGKRVALPFQTATLSRGDSHLFGIGILNIAESADFQVTIELAKAIDDTETEMEADPDIVNQWMLFNDESFQIEQNQHVKELISVKVPTTAPNGQYIFNVRVMSDNKQYGNTQKMYVTIK